MDFRKDFPIFELQPQPFHYLDSGATSQKPKQVINAVTHFYSLYNAPTHRSGYAIAQRATEAYEGVRKKVATFLNAQSEKEIIFTKNTNEGINVVAQALGIKVWLKQGDVVVLSKLEHNANTIPWLRLQKALGFTIYWIGFDENYELLYKLIPEAIAENVKVVSLAHVSNVTGTITPVKDIFSFFRSKSKNQIVCIVDGAQAVAHMPVDVQAIDCDAYAFSAHKMYAPSGVGVLYLRENMHPLTRPLLYGSHMVEGISQDLTDFEMADVPDRFEAGTGNLEGVIGLGAAIDYLRSFDWQAIQHHETELIIYTLDKLKALKLRLYGSPYSFKRGAVFSFDYLKVHTHDVAHFLAERGICVRAGHHCASAFMRTKNIPGTVRATLGLYNTKADVDALIKGLKELEKAYKV